MQDNVTKKTELVIDVNCPLIFILFQTNYFHLGSSSVKQSVW